MGGTSSRSEVGVWVPLVRCMPGWQCSCCQAIVDPTAGNVPRQCSSSGAAEIAVSAAAGVCSLKVPNVNSSVDSNDTQLWYTTPALAPTTEVLLSCSWRDQGWGNRKGALCARLQGVRNWVLITEEAAPHEKKHENFTVPLEIFNAEGHAVPIKLELGFRVGGGGGHQLNVDSAKLTITFNLCCICAVDLGYLCNLCDGCNECWTNLQAFESARPEDDARSSDPIQFHQDVNTTRAIVGRSLQYRLDLFLVNTLLQSVKGCEVLATLVRDGGLHTGCSRATETLTILRSDGIVDLSVSPEVQQAARNEHGKTAPVKFSRCTIPACLRMRSIASAAGLVALAPDAALTKIDLSHNVRLEHVPVDKLVDLASLTSIECKACRRLYSPPPEIGEMGGAAVVAYLRFARDSGHFNNAIEMIAIGNGESGKTSVIQAMMNGHSAKIHEDKRTVGIDLKTWDLSHEAGVIFYIKDLAGQAVYTLTNQFFLVQRAIYLLVWRVDRGSSKEDALWEAQMTTMVLNWMDSLQLRVPGASMLLVVTHIDCVPRHEVERQVQWVRKLVQAKLQEFSDDEDEDSLVPLRVWRGGESVAVNCLDGEGIQELKQEVIRMAKDLPWWHEAIPKFIMRFESEIKQQEAAGLSWLSWSDYHKLAKSLEDGSVQASLQRAQIRDDVLFSHPAFASDDEPRVNLGRAFDVTEGVWTICVSVRVDGPRKGQGGRIMAKRAGSRGWELVVPRWNGPISFFANGSHVNVGSTRVDDGHWHHCAVSYDGAGLVRCYVDGRFDGQHAFGKIKPVPDIDLWIGSRGGDDPLIDGEFKELVVFSRELAEDELGQFATGEAAIIKELFPRREGLVSLLKQAKAAGVGRDTWLVTGSPRFYVNWLNDKGQILFHFNPRPAERQIVMNDEVQGWGREERVAYDSGEAEATWTVAVDTAGFHVLSKGKEVHVFKHRHAWSTFAEVEHGESVAVQGYIPECDEGQEVGNLLRIATKFLHDKAALKYFGNISTVEKLKLIDRTVFIGSKWIIDVLKGLIRHDRSVLLTFFGLLDHEETRQMWLRRVHRLAIYGILHRDLIPFLWPGGISELSTRFWTWAHCQEEGELWSTDVAESDEDYARVMTLLEGCDILHRISDKEYAVPALLADTQRNRLDARAFSPAECTVVKAFCFPLVPTGFFERLLIKCRKSYSHMDFSVDSAALYRRGLKAQLFLYRTKVVKPRMAEERSAVVLKCLTSTREQMAAIQSNIDDLLSFFPGMRCVDNKALDGRNGSEQEQSLEFDQWLLDNGWRRPDAVQSMSAEEKRNTVIVELSNHQVGTTEQCQAMSNEQLHALCRQHWDREPIQVRLIESVPALNASFKLPAASYSEDNLKECVARAFGCRVSVDEVTISHQSNMSKTAGVGWDTWLVTGAPRFYVNWLNDKGQILFHFNPRPAERQIVMNDEVQGWGREECVAYDSGEAEATWTVAVDTAGFHVLSKGKEVHVFKHRHAWSTFAEVEHGESVAVQGYIPVCDEGVNHEKVDMRQVVVRVDTLKQPPPTVEALNTELKREFADFLSKTTEQTLAQSLSWTPTYSKVIEQAIHDIDQENAVHEGAQQHQALTIESGPDPLNTRRLRVVLVLMDGHIASSERALQQFRAAIAARLAVIAILLPGYVVTDYSSWWPPNMDEMHKHALFVDMRRMHESARELRAKISRELLPQVLKFLEEWRGQAPDPSAFADATDRIPCVQCSEASVPQPHIFSRSECEEKLRMWRTQRHQLGEAGGQSQGLVAAVGEEEQESTLEATCKHGHTAEVVEILSRNVIYSAVPCPCCVQSGSVPPFCFNREACLLYFSEDSLNAGREGSVTCPVCSQAGRPSSLRVQDIIVPEIFISYNWGVNLSTQNIVKPMRLRIEQDADVVCWFDVGGGMGAGQNHLDEMKEGIRKCTVVVLFLSDAYCKSPNCVREFLHATRHCKFLIVVLVPDRGPIYPDGPRSGWTGPGPENKDYWKHAASCSSCKDPDTGAAFSWAALSSFEPIDLRVRDDQLAEEEQRDAEERLLQAAEREIVKRIQSRFHRGEHIQNTLRKSYAHWRRFALFDSFTANADNLDNVQEEAISMFHALDTNQDGIINKEELLSGFPQIDEVTADLLFAEVDSDQDGGINFDELWDMIQNVASSSSRVKVQSLQAPMHDTRASEQIRGSRRASMVFEASKDANQSGDDENQSGDEGKETPGPVEKRHPQNEPSREVVNSEAAVTAVDGSACCIIA